MARQFTPHYFEPRISIRADRLCFYSFWTGLPKPRTKEIKRVISNDTLTYTARQRLVSAVNLLVGTAKTKKLYSEDLKAWFNFRINFVTLTLPSLQQHSDKEIHQKVFKSFIRYWTTRNPSLLYVYKAEVQDNGNLHYHLTTNSFIHHKKLRKMWNKACNLLGYVDRCKVQDPNSTDVHAVKNVKNLAAYLCKYVSKTDNYSKVLFRYHRRFNVQILKDKSDSFKLPTNYFKHLKRKVSIKLWDASKSLLIKPLSLSLSSYSNELAVKELTGFFTKLSVYDYVSVAYLNTFTCPKNNPIIAEYLGYVSSVIKTNSKAVHILN